MEGNLQSHHTSIDILYYSEMSTASSRTNFDAALFIYGAVPTRRVPSDSASAWS